MVRECRVGGREMCDIIWWDSGDEGGDGSSGGRVLAQALNVENGISM